MNQDRRQILQMLAEGKVTADEAERLIAALDRSVAADPTPVLSANGSGRAKYLRVCVDTDDSHGKPTKVNIRVPMQLLRAGVRLASLIPPEARNQVNAAMRENGVPFGLGDLKPENLDELVDHLNDLTVDVDTVDEHTGRTQVRIFAE